MLTRGRARIETLFHSTGHDAHTMPHASVALVGECMIELQGEAYGTMRQTFGGDTLNTAVYLARCAPGVAVHYATAVGDDPLSDGLVERWQAEGVATDLVRRIPGRLPGLYLIETDGRGERRFSYWRDTSAAKAYFDADTTPLEARAAEWQALYLSGISLAILPPAGRERLYALMRALRDRGAMVAFDNNYRPRLWPDRDAAAACFERALALATVALVSLDDHQALFGAGRDAGEIRGGELVVKRGADATRVRPAPQSPWHEVPTERLERVVDTTAAGDSFAAGYLARRLAGADPLDATRFGNRLAARVVQHRGALIPRDAMRDLMAT